MSNLPLDVRDGLTRIDLVPPSVQLLRSQAELNNEVPRQVLPLDLAAFFTPKSDKGNLIMAHDNSGIRATDEIAAIPIAI